MEGNDIGWPPVLPAKCDTAASPNVSSLVVLLQISASMSGLENRRLARVPQGLIPYVCNSAIQDLISDDKGPW